MAHGLNLEGKCVTRHFEAFGNSGVIYKIGFGDHNIALYIEKAKCPLCQ